MVVEIKLKQIDDDNPSIKHAREVDDLKEQCETCKLWKPSTPTKDCAIREKLVKKDSEVAWKNRHLFMHANGRCKMHQPRERKLL